MERRWNDFRSALRIWRSAGGQRAARPDGDFCSLRLLATLCGATSCTDMALFARMKAYLWRDVLVLKHGLPSHDTFSRVFRMLDPEAFETAFRRFMRAFAEVRGSSGRRGWLRSTARRCGAATSAARAICRRSWSRPGRRRRAWRWPMCWPPTTTKSPEPCNCRASPAQRLRGDGRCAALPSRHGQGDRGARRRLRSGGEGEPAGAAGRRQGCDPCRGAQTASKRSRPPTPITAARKSAGARRTGQDMAQEHDFPGLKAVARITSKRGNDKTVERYFLMSRNFSRHEVLRIVRTHWSIENGLHWPLDVTLDEDLRATERTTARPTSPSSGAWPSTSPAPIPTTKSPCGASSNAPGGTMPISSISSATCDSPALAGEG